MAERIEHPYPDCERCGINLKYTGSHYHCGGCDSDDVTSMMGHHMSGHLINGKWVKTEFHHCRLTTTGECELNEPNVARA
jgi:hypothetical protein